MSLVKVYLNLMKRAGWWMAQFFEEVAASEPACRFCSRLACYHAADGPPPDDDV